MPSPFLQVIGPLLRGTLWESIAVPERRGQSLRVAELLLEESALRLKAARTAEAEPPVIEYWI